MRTARLLTVSQHALHAGGVCLEEGGVCAGGGDVSARGVWGGVDTPPVNRMTERCKNITLSQLRCGR